MARPTTCTACAPRNSNARFRRSLIAVGQSEIARVLKPCGVALHIMPSVVWRFWTLLTHYWALPKLAVAWLAGLPIPGVGTTGPTGGISWWLRRIFLAMPHGVMGGALIELKSFSRRAWCERFAATGWCVLRSRPLGYFYSGYVLFGGRLPLSVRARLGRILGSSSTLYLVVPTKPVTGNDV